MGDVDHYYDQFTIADFINNPVVTLANAIQLVAAEFDTAGRARIFGKYIYTAEDSLDIGIGDCTQIFRNGTFEGDFIICHSPSDH